MTGNRREIAGSMAQGTEKQLRNQVMYSVFVRNYSERGDFEGVRRDLARIRRLGADIIWLMPIHPIGSVRRKGTEGSPYAISDYRAVNPAYGTVDDLRHLAEDCRAAGMRLIIDVVYNHTSPDSALVREHPEWFWKRQDGSMGNRIGDWTDIVDLDYSCRKLWEYQAETLCRWAGIVDGFRCDVAPLIPLDFWKYAREKVSRVNPDCLWLAESVEPLFVRDARAAGYGCLSDSELYQVFDICYEYDSYPVMIDYIEGRCPLDDYVRMLNLQESVYPENYVKLRFLENHDRPRAAALLPDSAVRKNWTTFLFFQKGMPLLYAGQEYGIPHLPALFERDPLPALPQYSDSSVQDISAEHTFAEHDSAGDVSAKAASAEAAFVRRLCALRRSPVFTDSRYEVRALPGDILLAEHRSQRGRLLGVFRLKGGKMPAEINLPAPDGVYRNLTDGRPAEVRQGLLSVLENPVIIQVS